MSLIEISFTRSREIVSKSINLVLSETISNTNLSYKIKDNQYFLLFICNFIAVIIFSIGAGIDSNFRIGLIISIIIILLLIIVNWILLKRYLIVEKQELIHEIKSIVDEYNYLLEKYQNLSTNIDIHPRLINGGHSHVSIVAVFRDGQWHRLPTLLLVEGDIISLMSGDTAPGNIYELIPDENINININNNNNNLNIFSSSSSSSKYKDKNGWRKGQYLERGTKILLREERKKYAAQTDQPHNEGPSFINLETFSEYNKEIIDNNNNSFNMKKLNNNNNQEKHKQSRAINSQSIELLTLSGDMRCFLLAETPIVKYCKETLNSNTNSTQINNNIRDSYVRSLYYCIFNEGIKALGFITILLIVAIIVRMIILSEADRKQITLV